MNSVSSVFKKRLEPLPGPPPWGGRDWGPSPALPVGEGEAGAMVERNETFNVFIFVPGTGR